jgi:hypothetical protein
MCELARARNAKRRVEPPAPSLRAHIPGNSGTDRLRLQVVSIQGAGMRTVCDATIQPMQGPLHVPTMKRSGRAMPFRERISAQVYELVFEGGNSRVKCMRRRRAAL